MAMTDEERHQLAMQLDKEMNDFIAEKMSQQQKGEHEGNQTIDPCAESTEREDNIMATPQKRTIGKLETWEPEDKSFSKHLLSEGIGHITPNDGSACNVLINFVDAVEIPEGRLGGYKIAEPSEITIGEGDTLLSELFDKVVCSMKESETSYIKSKIDVDGNKVDDVLAKSKAMKFNIILKSFNRAAEVEELENDEKIEKAQHHKDKGSELFKQENIEFAAKRYMKAIIFLEHLDKVENLPDSLRTQANTLQVQCYNNLGACHLKYEKYDDVIAAVDKALLYDARNVKALFRRGLAYSKQHKYDKAKQDFSVVLEQEPSNAAAKRQLKEVEAAVKKEKDMYQKMFNK